MVFIEVLCTNGHRVKVNCSPNTSLRQILEEACIKKNLLPVDKYGLKHNGKNLDLSQPFRFTGLVNNSKVEMVEVGQVIASQVIVAVQLEDGRRVQVTVVPTATLTEVFEAVVRSSPDLSDFFSVGSHPNLTPVAVHFREEIIGGFCLTNTSLKSLGLTQGRTVLRFFWRKDAEEAAAEAERTLRSRLAASAQSNTAPVQSHTAPVQPHTASVQPHTAPLQPHSAHVQPHSAPVQPHTAPAQSPAVRASTGASTGAGGGSDTFSWFWDPPEAVQKKQADVVSQFNSHPFARTAPAPSTALQDFKFPEETAGQNLYQNDLSSKKIDNSFRCDRRPVWFSPSQAPKPESAAASDPLPDSFFELTEEDMKKMLADLRKRVKEETESPLMTASMRKAARFARYSKYNHAVIRFVFHDGVILQAIFHPQETTYHLYKFIRNELTHSKFILYTTPPKKVLKDAPDTLIEADLVPLTRVYVGGDVEASGAVVRPNVKLSSEDAARQVVMDCLNAIDGDTQNESVSKVGSSSSYPRPSSGRPSQDTKDKHVPKWFKTGR